MSNTFTHPGASEPFSSPESTQILAASFPETHEIKPTEPSVGEQLAAELHAIAARNRSESVNAPIVTHEQAAARQSDAIAEARAVIAEGIESDSERKASRLARVLEHFDNNSERATELGIRSHEAVLCDSYHIENQEINFIDARDQGHITAEFKLTSGHFTAVTERLEELDRQGDSTIKNGQIRYTSFTDSGDFILSEAYELDLDGLIIKIAKPKVVSGDAQINDNRGDMSQVRAAIGLVSIEIPYDNNTPIRAGNIESRVNSALTSLLEIPEGLAEPSTEAARQYQEARYLWHHKIEPDLLSQEQTDEVSKLKRQEVFPGYKTMVSTGKHVGYESSYGEFALYHQVNSADHLVEIIKNGGLMSSHERFSRGSFMNGMSSDTDFITGGADSVFTRMVCKSTKKESVPLYTFVMGPELCDRTDWYAYKSDRYGSTGEEFKTRQSPEELLGAEYLPTTNEQMFRTGIPSETFQAIVCADVPNIRVQIGMALQISPEELEALWDKGPEAVRTELAKGSDQLDDGFKQHCEDIIIQDPRMNVIDKLHKAGIAEVNGVPVEQFVVTTNKTDDFINITHGRAPSPREPVTIPKLVYTDKVGSDPTEDPLDWV